MLAGNYIAKWPIKKQSLCGMVSILLAFKNDGNL